MSLFLTDIEKQTLQRARGSDPLRPFYWALVNRVERRAASPGLADPDTCVDWWHYAAEYLTDAALVYAIKPSENLSVWLREVTLSIARRPVGDWVGPAFRNHTLQPSTGHLETAHLAWSVAIVLDLAASAFTEEEQQELAETLREKGLKLCQRWLAHFTHLANWRCVLNAGVAVTAAVLNDRAALEQATAEFNRCLDIFQPDGSYSESLQYGNYAAYTLMLAWEALSRRNPDLSLPLTPYAQKTRWDAASLFYKKPLSDWGAYPRPRSANFNDSAALYRASADLLLHIAVRGRDSLPEEAGLARWLFDTLYQPCIEQGPHNQATFGFVNDFGFLTLILLPSAAKAITPEEAGIPLAAGFSCGDVLIRDSWEKGRTVLAVRGAGEALRGPGHLHGDLNSFILVHNQERLLVDPGHSCYRNLIHDLESSTLTHNTCTFTLANEESARDLQQSRSCRRNIDSETGIAQAPVHRGGRRLLLERHGDVTVMASEVADLYGEPITEFIRFWFLCGSHALFIVDRITSSLPVNTSWNWLLNNRDDTLDLKLIQPDRFVARRGNAGLKFFHRGGGILHPPKYSYVHDAYHPLPNQPVEGKPGSGLLIRWTESKARTSRTVVHALCMDDPGAIAGWHLKTGDHFTALESPGAASTWKLETVADNSGFLLSESSSGLSHLVVLENGNWKLS